MVGGTEMDFRSVVESVWLMAMNWAYYVVDWMAGRWDDREILIRVGLRAF